MNPMQSEEVVERWNAKKALDELDLIYPVEGPLADRRAAEWPAAKAQPAGGVS
jgi:4'-phosphopantetheinyl transferase EntD